MKRTQGELKEPYDVIESKVQERTKELEAENNRLKNEVTALTIRAKEIEQLAYYNGLTGLPNRRLFGEYLIKAINDSLRNKRPFCVVFLDLDCFKMINDTMGYSRGDELLKQAANRLVDTLRITDTIGHPGGDEFIIIIQNTPDVQTSRIIADKVIKSFQKPFQIDGNGIHITASMGISMYPIDGDDSEALIKNAEIAMYKAKENGKNRYEICTCAMKNDIIEVMELTSHMYKAVKQNELELYYQPQVDTDSGNLIGFEALLRWNHPEMGMLYPSKFIPIAEKTGLIIPIGEWVIKTVCKQNKIWQDEGVATVPVAVKLSEKQLMDHSFFDKVSKIIKEKDIDPCFLEIEIAESVIVRQIDHISDMLDQLNELGVRISIDDFGMQYASLNYIKKLPIDRIKIGMDFVRGINIDKNDEQLIKEIIAMVNDLGIEAVAEGVESIAQKEFLKNIKCDAIQGYYVN